MHFFIRPVESLDTEEQQIKKIPDFPPERDASYGVDQYEYSGQNKVEGFSEPSGTFDDLEQGSEVELKNVAEKAEDDAGGEGDKQTVKLDQRWVDVGETRLSIVIVQIKQKKLGFRI